MIGYFCDEMDTENYELALNILDRIEKLTAPALVSRSMPIFRS